MNRRVKIAIVVGVVFIATILIPVIHHFQLKAEVNAYIAQLKAQGEPMDLVQVLPPPVPAEQNFVPSFLKTVSPIETNYDVVESNPPPSMRMVAPGKAMIGWEQPDVREFDETNSWSDFETTLDKERVALDSALQITNHPQLDFNMNYAGGFENLRLTNLIFLKRAALILSADAMVDLHRDDVDDAVKNTHAILLFANAMRHDRLEISELVRIAIVSIAEAKVWEILQTTNVTDKQLTELQQDWSRFDFIKGEENALEMERAVGESTFLRWRGSSAGLDTYLDMISRAQDSMGMGDENKSLWGKMKIRGKGFLWRYWWSYPDELRYLKCDEASLNAVRSVQSGGSFLDAIQTQTKALDELHVSSMDVEDYFSMILAAMDFHWLMSQSITDLYSLNRKVMRTEATKEVVITAIALKRYQLKNGHYPIDLASLVPEFLPEVPIDPVDGQPLHYRQQTPWAYLLYSVGENGKDDGGNPSFPKNYTGSSFYWASDVALDWVWPQPATPDEVQKYYEKLGKSN